MVIDVETQDLLDIAPGLPERGQPTEALDVPGPGVVGRERQGEIALVARQLLLQVSRPEIEVEMRLRCETASGSKPDSTSTTEAISSGSTPWREAMRPIASP